MVKSRILVVCLSVESLETMEKSLVTSEKHCLVPTIFHDTPGEKKLKFGTSSHLLSQYVSCISPTLVLKSC